MRLRREPRTALSVRLAGEQSLGCAGSPRDIQLRRAMPSSLPDVRHGSRKAPALPFLMIFLRHRIFFLVFLYKSLNLLMHYSIVI